MVERLVKLQFRSQYRALRAESRLSKSQLLAPAGFPILLSEIKARIQLAQSQAILAANAELIRLYWDIGRMIDQRQQREGWGAAVIPRLAGELRNELPEVKGFSERNIKSMLAFYRAYVDPSAIVQQPAAQLAGKSISRRSTATQKVQQPAAQITDSILWSVPWIHHVVLMAKIKDLPTRLWYMRQTIASGWSRNVLLTMIRSKAHRRYGAALTNFERLMPATQSDLARQTLKDPYIFDFLTLQKPFHERELETNLLRELERFLLELGHGFAFVGRQLQLRVGHNDSYIDLLFYHLKLRRFIVIDLKTGEFKPEYAGKMNFYLSVVDDQFRHESDQPSIGLILCQDRNQIIAEYTLRGISKPIGVSEYELTRALPPKLQSSLPTVEEIEAELAETTKTLSPRSKTDDRKATNKAPKTKRRGI
jgi:predicted nuclease of restriction endonuclease-like (RecB) superfamily